MQTSQFDIRRNLLISVLAKINMVAQAPLFQWPIFLAKEIEPLIGEIRNAEEQNVEIVDLYEMIIDIWKFDHHVVFLVEYLAYKNISLEYCSALKDKWGKEVSNPSFQFEIEKIVKIYLDRNWSKGAADFSVIADDIIKMKWGSL